MINIKNPVNDEIFQFSKFWLRDHCRCSECYNVETKQRKIDVLSTLTAKLHTARESYIDNGYVYKIIWNNGHISTYDIEFLVSCLKKQKIETLKSLPALQFPWNARLAKESKSQMHVKLPELISSEKVVIEAVKSLLTFGILFIENVPANTTMTEMAMRRLFPIMKTFFGEMWTFNDKQEHADTAYTKLYIGPHTDNTYFCDAAGLHSLHCIEHEGGEGGENFFVDGLEAVLELRKTDKRAYEILSTVHVPAEYIEEGQHHKYSSPIIKLDQYGELEQLRFNIYDRAILNTVTQKYMDDFYQSLQEFARILEQKTLQWTFKLNPGTFVIFDNWRVLHGRHAYTGKRTMTGCYVQRTDFLSRARTLGLLE